MDNIASPVENAYFLFSHGFRAKIEADLKDNHFTHINYIKYLSNLFGITAVRQPFPIAKNKL